MCEDDGRVVNITSSCSALCSAPKIIEIQVFMKMNKGRWDQRSKWYLDPSRKSCNSLCWHTAFKNISHEYCGH